MKIRPVGAGLFHEDGQTDTQTDMTKLIEAFRFSGNAPKTLCGYMLIPRSRTRLSPKKILRLSETSGDTGPSPCHIPKVLHLQLLR